MSIRDEIRALCAEHDKLMAEDAWMADRAARMVPPVQKSDGDGLVYRTHENNAPAPAPPPDAEPSESEPYPPLEQLHQAIAQFVVCWTNRKLDQALIARDRRIGILEGEIRELKGFVGGIVALLGQKQVDNVSLKHGDVTELPKRRMQNG